MSKLTKNEVANWIRNIIPYIENPAYLAPKGCFKGSQKVNPGDVIEYDACLMPHSPQVLEQSGNLKVLVDLYTNIEE